MKKIRLKGCLWKQGVNGLGVLGFHKLPYRKRFDTSARMHDKLYDCGGTGIDRLRADRIFLQDCLRCSISDLQCLTAILYYLVVRMFGWAFFRYNRQAL